MRTRRAFTLIEVLVVMAIIAVIVALLLPAMVGARSASRRVNCINNLKQIELALQSYLTAYNVLPSGSYDAVRPVSSEPGGYKVSWIVSILPYMEQSALYHSFDFRHGADDAANQTVRMSWINSLLCPSDDSAGRSWFAGWPPPASGVEPGRTSYAACHHEVEAPIDEDNHGVFFLNSHVRVVDVTDGFSQTLFVGEVPWRLSPGWVSGTRASLRNTGHPINGVTVAAVALAGAGSPRLSETLTLQELDRKIDSGELKVAPTFVGGFGSSHVGRGANFAFGDGSVRFLKQSIDSTVYQRLGHRCDGETIDEEAY
jgi:prepilin-type N-terminal cleavage/methylation domain-containing protein/prepilin-type processing-associated H-X9-DG protein